MHSLLIIMIELLSSRCPKLDNICAHFCLMEMKRFYWRIYDKMKHTVKYFFMIVRFFNNTFSSNNAIFSMNEYKIVQIIQSGVLT